MQRQSDGNAQSLGELVSCVTSSLESGLPVPLHTLSSHYFISLPSSNLCPFPSLISFNPFFCILLISFPSHSLPFALISSHLSRSPFPSYHLASIIFFFPSSFASPQLATCNNTFSYVFPLLLGITGCNLQLDHPTSPQIQSHW